MGNRKMYSKGGGGGSASIQSVGTHSGVVVPAEKYEARPLSTILHAILRHWEGENTLRNIDDGDAGGEGGDRGGRGDRPRARDGGAAPTPSTGVLNII